MTNISAGKRIAALALLVTIWSMPLTAFAQTRIVAPKNKYKIQDDIKLGNDAAKQVQGQFPMVADQDVQRYVAKVGYNLVAAIPSEFRQPAFDYRFEVVNASDINAFALPGGPMFVDRGMIEAAKNEGEMAGVMAHEISHVALRHATAQATKQGSIGNQLGMIGMILGGAILGGEAGAQLGAAGAMAWMTKYSREYETQADVLGAQIMTDAGYDPHDLANMFKTIQEQSGGSRVPQWLSDHPDPGNRYENINREASHLNISPNPIKITRDFERIKSRLRSMPPARSMAEIEKGIKNGENNRTSPTASGHYSNRVTLPSSRTVLYNSGGIALRVPSNWRQFPDGSDVMFAPDGAYGDQGITRGIMIGRYRGSTGDLQRNTEEYINGVLQGNSYLRGRSGGSQNFSIDGRRAIANAFAGTSPVTGSTELVTIYTVGLNSGEIFYAVTVVPEREYNGYDPAFRRTIRSIRLND
jgi:hypothetical protein